MRKELWVRLSLIALPVILFLISETVNAQITFENLTSENGLSQNSVMAICEDKNGFIWLGTRDGLNKYDGYDLVTYYKEPYDEKSLSSNSIFSITESRDGCLYIGTQSGLNKLIIDEERFVRISLELYSNTYQPLIRKVLEDGGNHLWLGTEDGVIFFNPESKKEKLYSSEFGGEIIWDLLQDSRGTIWASSSRKIYRYNSTKDVFVEFPIEYKNGTEKIHGDFYEDKDGRIWIGAEKGLYVVEKESKKAIHITEILKWVDDRYLKEVYTINGNGDNIIWIGSLQNGLCCLDLKTKKCINYGWRAINPFAAGAANISNITIDKSGRLWLGTNGGGVAFWNPLKSQFKLLNNRRIAMVNASIRAIYKDKNNNIWIGGYDGLDKIDKKNKKVINYIFTPGKESAISSKTVRTIAEDPENSNLLWLGYENEGLSSFNKTSGLAERIKTDSLKLKGLMTKSVFHILFDSKNYMWLATSNGVYKLNKERHVVAIYKEGKGQTDLRDKNIVFLMEDKDQNIWAATNRSGVVKIIGGSGTPENYTHSLTDINSIASDMVYCIAQDNYGNMWIGTDAGLDRFDPITKKFEHFNRTNGLPNNTIYGILIDEYNNLWLSTNDGLSKYNPKENSFYNYDIRFQLQDKEFNSGAFYRAYDGEMFFGGIKGLNSFYPTDIKTISDFPKVALINLLLSNEKVAVGQKINGRVILNKSITTSREVEFDYNQNIIGINYAALEYSGNKNIQYAYKMENFEEEWNLAGKRKFASYVKLPPGKYIFKVKSTNAEGIWSDDYTSLSIIVHPAFWNTWYIKSLYWFAGIVVIFVVVASFKKNLMTKQHELEKQKEISEKLIRVDKLKDNFLAQISHEIRTPINSILSYSSLIEEDVHEHVSDDLKFSFDSIRNAGKRIIRTVDLILNFSEVQSGTYVYKESVFDFMEDVLNPIYMEFMLLAKKKGIVLNIKSEQTNSAIKGDQYSIAQIMANLIENAIKYTFDGYVEISITEKNGKLCVDVNDTGVGVSQEFLPSLFNPFTQETEGYTRKFEGNGLGLALVKKYCELNKVEISVRSEKNMGTTFSLEFRQA